MDRKTTGIVAYLTWVGLLVAILLGDREGAKFHINQALVIWLAGLLGFIPCVGLIWGLFCFINDEEKEVPLLGQIKLLK